MLQVTYLIFQEFLSLFYTIYQFVGRTRCFRGNFMLKPLKKVFFYKFINDVWYFCKKKSIIHCKSVEKISYLEVSRGGRNYPLPPRIERFSKFGEKCHIFRQLPVFANFFFAKFPTSFYHFFYIFQLLSPPPP